MPGLVAAINRAGRNLPVWAVYGAGAMPFAWLVSAALVDGLGPDPIKAVEHRLGLCALQFLVAGLAISSLRHVEVNLLKHRRALGLLSFFYAVLHFLAWVALDMGFDIGKIMAAVWNRPYISIGFAAMLGLVPLAITSSNKAVRRLGPKAWRQLHKTTYVIVVAVIFHYLLSVKVVSAEPLIYATLIAALLTTRLFPKVRGGAMSNARQGTQ